MNIIKDQDIQKLVDELINISIEYDDIRILQSEILQSINPYIKKWRKQAEEESNCMLCEASTNAFYWQEEVKELKVLCHDLLEGVDTIGFAPYYITKHLLNVIEKHKEIIKKYELK